MQVAIRIIPADTGSTPSWIRRPWPARDHPRRCGEHSKRPRKRSTRRGSFPRMRRAPRLHGHRMMSGRIIPADAGSTRRFPDPAWAGRGSSPRMRGARLAQYDGHVGSGIIPADAGSTCLPMTLILTRRDHPRGCGEHAPVLGAGQMPAGSSPRMRGAQPPALRVRIIPRIIPADAGSTRSGGCSWRGNADHPRGCGEHGSNEMSFFLRTGSSPRMRGAPWHLYHV